MKVPGFLTRNLRLKGIASALSLTTWFGVVYAGNPPETRTVVVHVPQDVQSVPARFVLVRPIADLALRISGTRDHVSAFDAASLTVTVNFAVIQQAGVQPLPVTVVNHDHNVDVETPPVTVQADVDELGSTSVPVNVSVSNPPPRGYVTSAVAATPDHVTLTGPKRELQGVAARAAVDMTNQRTNFQADIPLLLFDATGHRVNDLGVDPPTVRVTMTVSASITSRASAVLPRVSGSVAPGHQLTGIAAIPTTVILSGPQDLLNALDSIPTQPIALSGLGTADRTVSVAIVLPAGVSASPDTVQVHLTVSPLVVSPTPSPASSPSPTTAP